jgi:hypothetical protein
MEERRGFPRFSTKLKGQYLLEERTGDWGECTIVQISVKGMGVEFHSQEKINEGSTVHLAITASKEPDPIIVKGVLKWIKQKRNDSIGGIALTEMLDDITFAKLR